jgi:hypothetical protein
MHGTQWTLSGSILMSGGSLILQVLLNMICPGECPLRRKATAPAAEEQSQLSEGIGVGTVENTDGTPVVYKPEDYWASDTTALVPWKENLYRQSGIPYREPTDSADRRRALRG